MLLFSKATPDGLVRQLKDLPPAPKVLQKLQKLIADDRSTLPMIAELIVMEPGLAARVVQMASSAHFSRGAKIDTPLEGIQRVGLKGVRELVTYAVASSLVGRPLVAYGLDAQTLWNRAIACGIAAGYLAQKSGKVDYDDAYTAGLMHGLGLLVLNNYASKQSVARTIESSGYPEDFSPAERAWVGFNHAAAGAALLQLWGFSDAVKTAVEFQITPENAPDKHKSLCYTVATARWARTMLCVKDEILPEMPSAEWLEGAGIAPDEFDEWLNVVRMRYEIAAGQLRIGG